jgi:hypothetical protein
VRARIPPVAALLDLMSVSDADSSVLRIQSCHRNCPNIIGQSWRNCAVDAFPRWDSDRLGSVLQGNARVISSSDPQFKGYPSITVRFSRGHSAVAAEYFLQSGRVGQGRFPYLRSSSVLGQCGCEWVCRIVRRRLMF